MLGGCTNGASAVPSEQIIDTKMEAQMASMLKEVTQAVQALRDDQKSAAQALMAQLANQASGKEGAGAITSTKRKMDSVSVDVAIAVRRIFNVDTVNQTFCASLLLIMVWELPEGSEEPDPLDADWEPEWKPNYRIKRLIEEISTASDYTVFRQPGNDDKLFVRAHYEHIVSIFEELELQAFPVDCQDLTIRIECGQNVDLVKWSAFTDKKTASLDGKRSSLADFCLIEHKGLPGFVWHLGQAKDEETGGQKSFIELSAKVQRKFSYYFTNVILQMFCISTLTVCAWGSHPSSVDARQGVDFNLILTAVAFKLVLSSMLPKVSYMTLLDWYVMGAFLYLVGVTISHSCIQFRYVTFLDNSPLTFPPNSFEDEQNLIDLDAMSLRVSTCLWAAFNVLYGLFFMWKRQTEFNGFVDDALTQQAKYDKDNYGQSIAGTGSFGG